MEFPFPTCPLTGIPTLGHANAVPTGYQQVLYSFRPIGSAIFSLGQAIRLSLDIKNEQLVPRPDLAGLSREAAEDGQSPFLISPELFAGPKGNTPETFEEKQDHFLKFLYRKGGREHKKRDLFVYNDFPLAFAKNAKEFFEILESLISEELIDCNNPGEDLNAWPFGIRGEYYGVLPTRQGKQKAKELLTGKTISPPIQSAVTAVPSLTHLHPTIQQVSGPLFGGGHYRQAVLDACIALDRTVQVKAQLSAATTGTALMTKVFSANSPLIRLSTDANEQMGFMNLYQGSVQAIRNHYGHNLTEIPDPARALEWLGFISALFYKLDEAQPSATPPTS